MVEDATLIEADRALACSAGIERFTLELVEFVLCLPQVILEFGILTFHLCLLNFHSLEVCSCFTELLLSSLQLCLRLGELSLQLLIGSLDLG